MKRVLAHGLAAIAALVMATSSSTACCSSLLGWLRPAESCCHRANADAAPERAQCQCCTADNGQPFVGAAALQLEAPRVASVTEIELAQPVLAGREAVRLWRWHARPPPLLARHVVLLI